MYVPSGLTGRSWRLLVTLALSGSQRSRRKTSRPQANQAFPRHPDNEDSKAEIKRLAQRVFSPRWIECRALQCALVTKWLDWTERAVYIDALSERGDRGDKQHRERSTEIGRAPIDQRGSSTSGTRTGSSPHGRPSNPKQQRLATPVHLETPRRSTSPWISCRQSFRSSSGLQFQARVARMNHHVQYRAARYRSVDRIRSRNVRHSLNCSSLTKGRGKNQDTKTSSSSASASLDSRCTAVPGSCSTLSTRTVTSISKRRRHQSSQHEPTSTKSRCPPHCLPARVEEIMVRAACRRCRAGPGCRSAHRASPPSPAISEQRSLASAATHGTPAGRAALAAARAHPFQGCTVERSLAAWSWWSDAAVVVVVDENRPPSSWSVATASVVAAACRLAAAKTRCHHPLPASFRSTGTIGTGTVVQPHRGYATAQDEPGRSPLHALYRYIYVPRGCRTVLYCRAASPTTRRNFGLFAGTRKEMRS